MKNQWMKSNELRKKKEEQKSVLTMVSTNAWTNNTEFDNLGSICLKEIVFESLYE